MSSALGGRMTRSRTATSTAATSVAPQTSQTQAGEKRKKVLTELADSVETKKKSKKAKLNSSIAHDEDVEMNVPESLTTSLTTASATPSTAPTATVTSSFNSVKDQPTINALLRGPLPNVLADMVTEYLFHPLFNLWDEIISVYESLPQMPKEEKEKKTADKKRKKTVKKTEQIELMPKLQLSPPASPKEVDELEQQFQLKYADPTFHFSSELKLLWSIADGLEAPENMIFRGRFWPSLANMRSILACPENSYYVVYHTHAQHNSAWLKYDFRSGTIYACGCYEEQDEPFNEDTMVIVFHSITHFMKALLATLRIAGVDADNYRNYHTPAIHVDHARGFVPSPSVDLSDDMPEWDFLLLDEIIVQPQEALISGHLTSAEYLTIRKSICAHENEWVERVLNLSEDELWLKRAPKSNSTANDDMNDEDAEDDDEDDDSIGYKEYCGFPALSPCHLLDAMDDYGN